MTSSKTPLPDPLSSTEAAARVDFLGRFLADQAEGRVRPLGDYQALFPGHAELIANEYQRCSKEGGLTATMASASLGPYVLERELGRGGQGEVWLAHDPRIDRAVAIKIVSRGPFHGELTPRLQREAHALSRLDHPNLGRVFDVGADSDQAWIAMRYEEGPTLAEVFEKGEAPAEVVLGWVETLARGLHAAHEAGLIHRDVKPGNVIIRAGDGPVLLDFGIAADDEAEGAPLTYSGHMLGTPAYMSPEQLGSGARPDRRTDVWSLGVLLYEGLAGERPFASPTREGLVRAVLEEEPAELPAIGSVSRRNLRAVLETALSKERNARYATALDLAEDLKRLRAGDAVRARPVGRLAKTLRWSRKRPALAVALLAVIASAILSTTLFLDSRQRLSDFLRLADLERARDLILAHGTLFPLSPDTAPRFDPWLERTELLLAREPIHRAMLQRLPADYGDDWADDKTGELWMRSQIEDLLERFDELRALHVRLLPRAELARNQDRFLVEDHAEAWRLAAERMRRDDRFPGFELEPQRGLLPLGKDPGSGLEEFAFLGSGDVPTRDPNTGKLLRTPGFCLVFVLIPFGETIVGSSPFDEDGLHPDPGFGQWDGPPVLLRLDPFFVSKYELTQGQWAMHVGTNDAYYTKIEHRVEEPGLHPVENVSLIRMRVVLAELGLQLPTEAQWEHAARGGTPTPWSFGPHPLDVAGFANIADESVRPRNNELGWILTEGINDGHIVHAPVGSFMANPWGLHDVHGNIAEWTCSTYEDWATDPPRDGSGETPANYELFVVRGGGFSSPVPGVRSSNRVGLPENVQSSSLGVRPVLPYRSMKTR